MEEIINTIQIWAPRILAALVILVIGYVLARAVKWGVASLIDKTPLAKKANDPSLPKKSPKSIGAQVGTAAFWVVMLVAISLAAQPLGLTAATGPLGAMLSDILAALPRILGAILILFLGYILASVAQKAVVALVSAAKVEKVTEKVGHKPPSDAKLLPRVAGGVVFALIIIPAAIAALDVLNIAAISEPATAMLQTFINAIPRIIAAGIILAIAYMIGRFASKLLADFLATTPFDRMVASLGLSKPSADPARKSRVMIDGEPMPATSAAGGMTPSKAVGAAAFIAIIIFGLIEAFRVLDFAAGSRIMAEILALFGQVAFGAIIIVAAVAIAKLVASVVEASAGKLTASFVRAAIIVLGVAIGLRFMGLADDIITLAFGLVLGAIAIAAAIAFGIGGREPAKEILQKLADKVEEKSEKPSKSDGRQPPAPVTH